jgi:formylglycine-generating enzyme required for sulfatase activity
MKFVHIEPGEFEMGSPPDEAGRYETEARHHVNLTKPFLLGAHPVTRGQFAAFVKDTDHKTLAEKEGWGGAWTGKTWSHEKGVSWRNPGFPQDDDHPVVEVTWFDAVAFTEWFSKKDGAHYRLPTEAEWEYAARAGTTSAFPWGDNPDDGKGWANGADLSAKEKFPVWDTFNWSDGFVYTSPVGRFKVNAWGLYDMVGNVWEWCSDWYGEYSGDAIDPQGPVRPKDFWRMLRGGSWNRPPRDCRFGRRGGDVPMFRTRDIGFRIVRDL